jgi:hypothetical protein
MRRYHFLPFGGLLSGYCDISETTDDDRDPELDEAQAGEEEASEEAQDRVRKGVPKSLEGTYSRLIALILHHDHPFHR